MSTDPPASGTPTMLNLLFRASLSCLILIVLASVLMLMLFTQPVRGGTIPDTGVPVLGENLDPFVDEGPYYADNEPVRIKIDPTLQNAFVPMEFTMDVWFQNFTYQPEEATALPGQYTNGKRAPQEGHFHVYGTYLDDNAPDPTDPLFWNYTNLFLGAPAATLIGPGHVQFEIVLPAPGEWQIRVDAQHDDHTLRVPPHPQNWNATDTVFVTADPVVPEPGALVLIAGGFAALLFHRPRR